MKKFFHSEAWDWTRVALEIFAIVFIVLGVVWVLRGAGLAEADGRCWVLCDPESCVRLRVGPRKTAAEFGSAECGTMLLTDSKERNGYLHVVDLAAEESEGWISVHYIVYDEPQEVNCSATVRSDGRVAVRKSVNGKITGWLKNGETIRVLWTSGEWSVTNRGYVMSEYLEMVGDAND